ncbi:CRISPR-associated helicase/endonuclease Cas3 [Xenorhabdus bovienii]|uniref:CRISPR-associated helicase/endonuclease Cas3 n=1 Tax=Xenorhabdus bovienii TaxID=40576 RepID=UPI00237CB72C|nr:CRISPR-associated helicase/endonuclease Cas3 [Xenorhabdus bovienii]MDE1483247.1 CRISPR-associated helicase/endonuclease Cas3 [Xenorhabdus bovienii]MDE9442031.1 CRISPR-associated helicase/endonuclease Cas3 [Xenorhabdus bovienii]MDE9461215.1 CRISPR-associated helicase/endonuclease Cas3 [Xenorhabdus bovienii]MDE9469520.1 CRISPR-associated helicase/endonuclease Cas3 [Xenorhabdus bovienii]
MNVTLICRYWGKARKPEGLDGDEYHLLPFHCLDVASVAAYWWDHSPGLRRLFCTHQDRNECEVRAWVLFLVALHDLGKFDIRFQYKSPQTRLFLNSKDQQSRLPSVKECQNYDHGAAGLYWFIDDHQPAPLADDDGFGLLTEPMAHPYQAWLPWMEAVCGHHGTIRQEKDVIHSADYPLPYSLRHCTERDKQSRIAWMDIVAELFLLPVGLSLQDVPPSCSVLMAGFCSVADWLGSWQTEDTFNYRATSVSDVAELRAYFEQRYREDAVRVVTRSGLVGRVKPGASVQELLDSGHKPRQLQVLIDKFPVAPGLTLIEAPTGSGKTETALAYAWRLLEHNLADSIIFALPTQATANAMLGRMNKLAEKLFTAPNLILAHGNAHFNTAFQAIKQRGRNLQGEEAWSQCCEWLSQGRKRFFLGQIGVCTIDQVLVSVLPLRHRFVRGFGVGRSVLIIDEVHAYDQYMYGLLDEVLRNQSRAGSSAILLSATLPQWQKRQLLNSYASLPNDAEGGQATAAEEAPYPLVSCIDNRGITFFDLQNQHEQHPAPFSLYLEPYYTEDAVPDNPLLQCMVDAARKGAHVCLICNLVDVAQQAWWKLKVLVAGTVDVMLFHARFSLVDRQAKENAVLGCFGKEGSRSCGRILVATQVVEQSLDVDFDWIITQPCPVDLLFQRLGRLHRHQWTARPDGFTQPTGIVLFPTADGYGSHSKIYGHTRVMWRTQQWVEALRGKPLSFPDAYRKWLEPIYRENRSELEPQWVTEGMATFEKNSFTKRMKARRMLDWAEQVGLRDDEGNERAVTRDGDMSISLVPFISTEAGKQLLDGRIYEQLGEFQQQEALACNQVSVPSWWEQKLGLVCDKWGRIWLEGNSHSADWVWSNKDRKLRYSHEQGMILVIPDKSQKGLGT